MSLKTLSAEYLYRGIWQSDNLYIFVFHFDKSISLSLQTYTHTHTHTHTHYKTSLSMGVMTVNNLYVFGTFNGLFDFYTSLKHV